MTGLSEGLSPHLFEWVSRLPTHPRHLPIHQRLTALGIVEDA